MPDTQASETELQARAKRLSLFGLLENWTQVKNEPWLKTLFELEETTRQRRSLERRLRYAKLGRFKPLSDFDYNWPKKLDRALLEDLFSLEWIRQGQNAIFLGPNGIGKTMLAKNLAHQAVLEGFTVRCCTASELLNDLASQDGPLALQRRIRHYASPALLLIDEVGYLSYDYRHADLLFEIVSQRYTERSVLITTNEPFAHWAKVFPNASCVVSLIDRLTHHAEILQIDGESYRLKESREERQRAQQRRRQKRARNPQ